MAKIDWTITGIGGQSIADDGTSSRCQLTGKKLMLWNGRDDLTDSEIVSDIKLQGNPSFCFGGLILRSDATGDNCYRFIRSYFPCRIEKVVNGVTTILGSVTSTFAYSAWVKTRFRIDGWQLSVEEYIDSLEKYQILMVAEDTSNTHTQGNAGLVGTSTNTNFSVYFDNISIGEKV